MTWANIKEASGITNDPDLLDIYYADDLETRFTIALTYFHGPAADLCSYHCHYDNQTESWKCNKRPDTIINRDRLWAEKDALGHAEATYPPTSNEQVARRLWNIVLNLDGREAWRIQPTPLMRNVFNGWTGKRIFTDPIRLNPPRTKQYMQEFARSLQGQGASGCRIGALQYKDHSTTLYLSLGTPGAPKLGMLLFRTKQHDEYLVDWNIETEDTALVIARVCTIPVELPRVVARGGAGTTLALTDLGGAAVAQLVRRLLNLGALNNQHEVLSYIDQSISEPARLAWWSMFQQATSTLKLEQLSEVLLTTLPNSQIVVSFPTPNGQQSIRCVLRPNRLTVVAVNVRPTAPKEAVAPLSAIPSTTRTTAQSDTEKQVREFMPRMIAAAKRGNAKQYCLSFRGSDKEQAAVVRWAQNSSGQYYDSVFCVEDAAVGVFLLVERTGSRFRPVFFFINYRNIRDIRVFNFRELPTTNQQEIEKMIKDPARYLAG